MENKQSGTTFEKDFCKLASEKGFWAHRLNENRNGQPADVILCRNDIPVLIDCKVCENNKFLFSRIEENQELAMTKWIKMGNKRALFALKLNDAVWMISFSCLMELRDYGYKQLNKSQIEKFGIRFEEWEELLSGNNSQ